MTEVNWSGVRKDPSGMKNGICTDGGWPMLGKWHITPSIQNPHTHLCHTSWPLWTGSLVHGRQWHYCPWQIPTWTPLADLVSSRIHSHPSHSPIAGHPPLQAQIHQRILTLYNSILQRSTSIEYEVIPRQLLMKTPHPADGQHSSEKSSSSISCPQPSSWSMTHHLS